MRLEYSDVELFYQLWFPLLDFVNRKYHVCPKAEIIDLEEGVDLCDAKAAADYLWSHTAVLEEYLAEAELPEEYEQIVAGWKRCKPGRYILERHLKSGAVSDLLRQRSKSGFQGCVHERKEKPDDPVHNLSE